MSRGYTIEVEVSKSFIKGLKDLEHGLNIVPFYQQIERKLTAGRQSVIGKNFMQGGRPHKWKRTKDLSVPPGVRVSSLGRRTLILTGRLRTSLTKGARLNATTIDNSGVYIDSDVPYAHKHNYGIGVPKREFAVIPDEDWTGIEKEGTTLLANTFKSYSGRVKI